MHQVRNAVHVHRQLLKALIDVANDNGSGVAEVLVSDLAPQISPDTRPSPLPRLSLRREVAESTTINNILPFLTIATDAEFAATLQCANYSSLAWNSPTVTSSLVSCIGIVAAL